MMNNPTPMVSVIIPAYNQSKFLERAIESVLSQTYRDYEIIVVDDGSVDNTREVAGKYQDRIKYIWQKNRGLAGARNTGIRAASGKYIGLLDSDDEWLPAYLEKMVGVAAEFPAAAVYYCMAQGIDVEGNPLPQAFGGPVMPPEELYPAMVRANFLIPSTIMMNSQIITDAGLFDDQLRSCEDWDLWLRLLPDHRFVGLNDCLVRYRVHGNSLSTNPSGMQQAARAVIQKNFGPEDGRTAEWSSLKRRAYGGLYFYHAWTSILRKGDWEASGEYLQKALLADSDLLLDLDLFFEILLGRQPVGFRGSSQCLDLAENVSQLEKILSKIIAAEPFSSQDRYATKLFATAYYAAGLLAYNTQDNKLARKYLSSALHRRISLLFDRRFFNVFLRSLLPAPLLDALKSLKASFR